MELSSLRYDSHKINAITVPEGIGSEVASRFAARAGAVDGPKDLKVSSYGNLKTEETSGW